MTALINLWDPGHVTGVAILVSAFLLGAVHGITPDEHSWPITFSYSIGSYSTRRGLRSGLIFSAAFTLQRAIASELAGYGLSHLLRIGWLDYAIYLLVGALMAWAGVWMRRSGHPLHLDLPGLRRYHAAGEEPAAGGGPERDPGRTRPISLRDPRPWMPAVHGFVAGWGFGAFALILLTVLAPAMHSALWAWVPGALFGLGTTAVQALAGGVFGWVAGRRGLPPEDVRHVALTTAARTLTWGGAAFVLGGAFGLAAPGIANASVSTGLHVHNLDTIGLPIVLVIISVVAVGLTTLVKETRRCIHSRSDSYRLGALHATVTAEPSES